MPVRVLIIDNDEANARRVRGLLAEGMREPFEADLAEGYAAGKRMLTDACHNVALLNYRLGEQTGIDLLDDEDVRTSNVPILLLAGSEDQSVDPDAMRAGAADFLQKGTLTAVELERAVRYAIQSRRLERQRSRLIREKAARRAAEAANQAKDDFLALLSHELRTPLNAISNWVQLLELDDVNQIDTETLAEAIDAIGRNVRLQAQLVDDLLDVSRIVAGKLELKRQPVDLARVCEDALEGCQSLALAKQIQVTSDLAAADTMGAFFGDPTRLQQIVWNLANNAVKFTQDGGHVALRLTADDTNVVITVADNGPGIGAKDLPFIFDRFRQGDTRLDVNTNGRTRPGGLGIGLALVRHLVELHGGSAEAESKTDGPDRGSVFTVTLPPHGMPA
ncbi:MAG: ATP-binding protein [Planctomycetota bacterium]